MIHGLFLFGISAPKWPRALSPDDPNVQHSHVRCECPLGLPSFFQPSVVHLIRSNPPGNSQISMVLGDQKATLKLRCQLAPSRKSAIHLMKRYPPHYVLYVPQEATYNLCWKLIAVPPSLCLRRKQPLFYQPRVMIGISPTQAV